jgi:hypothetical protein
LPAKVIKLGAPGGCPAPARSGAPWEADLSRLGGDGGSGSLALFTPATDGRYDDVTGWLRGDRTTSNVVTFQPDRVPRGATVFIVEYKSPNL